MEWYFCGLDGQCWLGWMSSPTTASWVQAIGTLLALIVAIGVALHGERSHRKRDADVRQSMTIANTAKIADFQGLGIGFVEILPIKEDADDHYVPFPRLSATLGQITRTTSVLDQLIVQESAHEKVATAAVGYLVGNEQVLMVLKHLISEAKWEVSEDELVFWNIEIPPKTREALREQVRLMAAVCDATHRFRVEYTKDAGAKFPRLDLPEFLGVDGERGDDDEDGES
ncbi:hypothetical protein ACLD0W_12785 [Alloalcanivorax sp. C16-1]|uniref:hypothetical protein n=1 Tax=Alloalcanivorax sp. C16-1 TaxID=3390051 RepID=UPI0039704C67